MRLVLVEFKFMLKNLSTINQYTAEGMAAITTMVGLPLLTGILSVLGAGPILVIAVAWLLPIGGLMLGTWYMGWQGRQM